MPSIENSTDMHLNNGDLSVALSYQVDLVLNCGTGSTVLGVSVSF